MGRYIGDKSDTAVKVPCSLPAIDDIFTVDPDDPRVGVWKKAETKNIGNLAITSAKLGDLAVDTGKLADGAITNAKVNAAAGIAGTKLAAGSGVLGHLDANGMLDNLSSITEKHLGTLATGDLAGSAGAPYSFIQDPAAANLIANPSFEVDTSNWSTVGSPTAFNTDNTLFKVGTRSGKLTVPGATSATTGFKSANISVGNSVTLTLSFWATVNLAGRDITAQIRAFDSGNVLIGSGSVRVDPLVLSFAASRRFSITYTTPAANTSYVQVQFDNSTKNQGTVWAFYIDGVLLEQAAVASSYFDGSFGNGYAWTGTANASSSTRTSGLKYLKAPTMPAALRRDGILECRGIEAAGFNILGAGATFPAGPSKDDVFFRTDRGVLYYYNGTAWVSSVAATLCAFNAYRSAAFTTTVPGGYTLIPYDTAGLVFDQGGNFTVGAAANFTAPFAGLYQFSASGGPSAGVTTEQYAIGLFVNGVQNNTGNIVRQGSAGDATSIVSTTLKLAAADVVTARLFSPTNRAMAVGKSFNWFSGHCVAALG